MQERLWSVSADRPQLAIEACEAWVASLSAPIATRFADRRRAMELAHQVAGVAMPEQVTDDTRNGGE